MLQRNKTNRGHQAMRIFLIAICLLIISNASANADFIIDVDQQEILEKFGEVTIQSLSVGETGLITMSNLCKSRDGRLMMHSRAKLDLEPSDFSNLIKVKRLPGGVWDADIRPGESGYGSNARQLSIEEAVIKIITKVVKDPFCETIIEKFYAGMGKSTIPLNSFAGATRLSELFPHLTSTPE